MPSTAASPSKMAPVKAAPQHSKRQRAGFRQLAREEKAPIAYAATLSAKVGPTGSEFMKPVQDRMIENFGYHRRTVSRASFRCDGQLLCAASSSPCGKRVIGI